MAATWWIDEPHLLGSSNPDDRDLATLRTSGFDVIVCLLDESEQSPRYDVARAAGLGYARRCIPVRDFQAPSVEQLEEFVTFVASLGEDAHVLVHCEVGIGRTGTMAAAYWVARGLSVADAIAKVRLARPGAVESEAQRRVLHDFATRCGARSTGSGDFHPTSTPPRTPARRGPRIAPERDGDPD
jgi:atypical dual specificity phosphatase